MGLDMYMYLRKHHYANQFSTKGQPSYPQELAFLEREIEENSFKSVSQETHYRVAYWRQFDILHDYIAEHYSQKLDNNCEPIYLDRKDMGDIISMCEKAIDDPTDRTFFFSDKNREFYLDETIYAVRILKEIVRAMDNDKDYDMVIYQADW